MSAPLQPIRSQPPHRPMSAESTAVLLRLPPDLYLTDDQLFELCRLDLELRIERTAQGGLAIMAPAGGDPGDKNAEITMQLRLWAKRDGTGRTFDSSGGFVLPDGATRSPDASWVRHGRLAALTAEERAKLLPPCPDLVIELRSPTDGLSALRDKMREYIENGAQLGWLIDLVAGQALVYRPGAPVECREEPENVSAGPALPGFRLSSPRSCSRRVRLGLPVTRGRGGASRLLRTAAKHCFRGWRFTPRGAVVPGNPQPERLQVSRGANADAPR